MAELRRLAPRTKETTKNRPSSTPIVRSHTMIDDAYNTMTKNNESCGWSVFHNAVQKILEKEKLDIDTEEYYDDSPSDKVIKYVYINLRKKVFNARAGVIMGNFSNTFASRASDKNDSKGIRQILK